MPQTIFVQMDVQVITWLQNEATTLFADRKSAEKVKVPSTAGWKSLPKMRKTAEKVEIPVAAGWKSLPKMRKTAEKVEIPSIAGCKSLPIMRKTREKGRDSCSRRSEISTQKAENRRKR